SDNLLFPGGKQLPSILICLLYVVQPAEITPLVLIGTKRQDFFSTGGKAQVGRDDREDAFFRHQRKEERRNDVDAVASQRTRLGCQAVALGFAIRCGFPVATM